MDGNGGWTPGTACTPDQIKQAKACQYLKDGQSYTPERFLGRRSSGCGLAAAGGAGVSREHGAVGEPWRPTFERLLSAIDQLYTNATLEDFYATARWSRTCVI